VQWVYCLLLDILSFNFLLDQKLLRLLFTYEANLGDVALGRFVFLILNINNSFSFVNYIFIYVFAI
jgi:hypothetical protein